jgi:hypothetical protein
VKRSTRGNDFIKKGVDNIRAISTMRCCSWSETSCGHNQRQRDIAGLRCCAPSISGASASRTPRAPWRG